MPLSESVKSWPVAGEVIYKTWQTGATDIKVIIVKYQDHIVKKKQSNKKRLTKLQGYLIKIIKI